MLTWGKESAVLKAVAPLCEPEKEGILTSTVSPLCSLTSKPYVSQIVVAASTSGSFAGQTKNPQCLGTATRQRNGRSSQVRANFESRGELGSTHRNAKYSALYYLQQWLVPLSAFLSALRTATEANRLLSRMSGRRHCSHASLQKDDPA